MKLQATVSKSSHSGLVKTLDSSIINISSFMDDYIETSIRNREKEAMKGSEVTYYKHLL